MQLFFHVCKFEAVEEDTAASLATMPQLVKEVLVADENSAVPSRSDRPESPDTECLSVLKSKIRTSKNAAALEGLQKISESTTVTSVGPNSTCDPVSNAVSQPVTVSLVGTQISAPKRVGAQKRKPPKLSPTRVEKVPTDPDTKEGLKVKVEIRPEGYFIAVKSGALPNPY